ncbi:MAG: porin family protein [Bacteroidales bacterium]|nr:PorT family protein [Bacteroidales bacterium]MDD2424456.1 porin family protein [Bacteroidales bacterium]MDD3989829.1 porin family protein [Bacteroidales bacterium]
MKKYALLLTLVLLSATTTFSQVRFGIKGGLGFANMSNVSSNLENTWNNQTGYHFGLALQMKVPFIGLAIQPELLYSTVRTTLENDPANEVNIDYLTLPINLQLGADLLLFRPFILASPFVSYVMKNNTRLEDQPFDDINRFDYGIGLGAGIDIWKLQIVGKYNWGLGKLQSAGAQWDQAETYKNATLQGFQLSVALLF